MTDSFARATFSKNVSQTSAFANRNAPSGVRPGWTIRPGGGSSGRTAVESNVLVLGRDVLMIEAIEATVLNPVREDRS
jgi:hypothetical protein